MTSGILLKTVRNRFQDNQRREGLRSELKLKE